MEKFKWCDMILTLEPWRYDKKEYSCRYFITRTRPSISNLMSSKVLTGTLNQLKHKKSKSIYIRGLVDMAYWDTEDIRNLTSLIDKYPQHNYIFITSFALSTDAFEFLARKSNVFFGLDVASKKDLYLIPNYNYDFIRIIPPAEDFGKVDFCSIKQIIIHSKRLYKNKPQLQLDKELLNNIVSQANKVNISIYIPRKAQLDTRPLYTHLLWHNDN